MARHDQRNSTQSVRSQVRRNSSVDRNGKRRNSTGLMSTDGKGSARLENESEAKMNEQNGVKMSGFSQRDSVKPKDDEWEIEDKE